MKILVLNAGSSSLKFELFAAEGLVSLAEGIVERIGADGSRLELEAEGRGKEVREGPFPDHRTALDEVLHALADADLLRGAKELLGVGHRVVHGGERFREPTRIDDDVIAGIRATIPLAPLHNPANLLGIEMATAALPGVGQVAVFDTAFHHTLPEHAYRYALPRWTYVDHGVRRYGFHGISYAYVAKATARYLGRPLEEVDLIVLHLGNGASAAAIQRGRSVDTSMGLTPLEGLVMGSRPGDLDPGIAGYLQDQAGIDASEFTRMLHEESGLLGLSGRVDMRDVSRRASEGDPDARLALEIQAYRIKKYVGAYLAVLGRADAICFTAGIGENQPEVRRRALEGLEGLGIEVDPQRNELRAEGIREIQPPGRDVKVLVVPTDEELEIAGSVVTCLA